MTTGNYFVDMGFQEQRATPVSKFEPAPYLKEVKNITTGTTGTPPTPEYEKWGLNSQEEMNLMQAVKDQGGTAEDFGFVLDDYRNKSSNIAIPKTDEEGNIIQDIGGALKVESKFDVDLGDAQTFGGALKNQLKTLANSARFAINIPGDAIELVGDIGEVVLNPIDTVKSVGALGGAVASKIGLAKETPERQAVIDGISSAINENFGSFDKAMETITQNPTDVLTTIFTGVGGTKAALQKSGKVSAETIKKLDNLQDAVNPINILKTEGALVGRPLGSITSGTADVGKTLIAKTSGLTPETISTIFKQPDLFKSGVTREGLATKTVTAIDNKIDEVKLLGKGYEKVKKGEVVTSADEVQGIARNVVGKFDNKELTKTDNSAIKDAMFYIDKYDGDITDSNILALRRQLDSIKYDASTGVKRKLSPTGERIITDIRTQIDDIAKSRMDGLAELDKKFAGEITELNKVRGLMFDRAGNLKDNYIQTVSNLLGKGKEVKLERIEKLVPEIKTELRALKALEDVEYAKGRTVAAYVQGGGLTAGLFGLIDPVTATIGLLLTSPTVVSNVIKASGYSARTVGSITQKIKDGVKLTASEAAILSKSIQSQVKEGAFKAGKGLNKKVGDLSDDVAIKVGGKANFVDDTIGTGKGLDDFAGEQLIKQDIDLQKAIKQLKKDELVEKLAKIEDENFRKILLEDIIK